MTHPRLSTLARLLASALLLAGIVRGFQAYLHPDNILAWLNLLALCR